MSVVSVGISASGVKAPSIWPLSQAVKTSPFHGEDTGSSPVGVTTTSRKRARLLEE